MLSEVSRKPTANGTIARPAIRGDRPAPCWTATAYTNMKPPKAMKNGTASNSPRRMPAIASKEGGSVGRPPRRSSRRSVTISRPASTGAAASSSSDHSGQRSARPSLRGSTTASTVAATSRAPGRSGRPGASERVSGTSRLASTRPISPIGTFTRKIGRQLVPAMFASTSAPPTAWPTTIPMPPVAPYKAMARVRASPVTSWPGWWPSTCGTINAAAAPWAIRAATRIPAVGASPQTRESTVNSDSPIRKSRLRPKVSPSRPPVTSSTAYATA